MTTIRQNTDGSSVSYNFTPPNTTGDVGNEKKEVLFPYFDKQTPEYAATIAVNVIQMETFVQPAELTGNLTLNLTVDEDIPAGAKLYLKLDADATNRVVTYGTGFDASIANLTVTADTVAFKTFVFDGTVFVPVA